MYGQGFPSLRQHDPDQVFRVYRRTHGISVPKLEHPSECVQSILFAASAIALKSNICAKPELCATISINSDEKKGPICSRNPFCWQAWLWDYCSCFRSIRQMLAIAGISAAGERLALAPAGPTDFLTATGHNVWPGAR